MCQPWVVRPNPLLVPSAPSPVQAMWLWRRAGIFRNNKAGEGELTMAELFDRVLPVSDAALRWDMGAWVPAAVVFNLATNDLSPANGPFGAEEQKLFVRAYTGDCDLSTRGPSSETSVADTSVQNTVHWGIVCTTPNTQ